jgi:hypothetical protein
MTVRDAIKSILYRVCVGLALVGCLVVMTEQPNDYRDIAISLVFAVLAVALRKEHP